MLCLYQSSNFVLFFSLPNSYVHICFSLLMTEFQYPTLFATMRQSAWPLLRFSTCFSSLLSGLYSFFIIFTRFCGRLMSFPSFFSHLSRFSFPSPLLHINAMQNLWRKHPVTQSLFPRHNTLQFSLIRDTTKELGIGK